MKGKLVYISNSRMPTQLAHGLQVMSMCRAFTQNGLQVELLVPRRVNRIREAPFSYYGIEKNFSIKKILCLDLIFLNNRSIFFWIQTLSFLLSVKSYLASKKYDILYTREQMVGLFFKNFVLEIHSLPKKTRKFHKKIWEKAKALVVLTPFIKQNLVDLGIPKEKIIVSPDGVDLELFDISVSKEEAREKTSLPQNKKLIGYVGMLRTLGMEKGIDTAILAMKRLDENTSLILVGGSLDDINYYKKMAMDKGLENRVIFTGRVSHQEIPIYLKAFDILIAPFPENQHYSYYMSPMKIFEYMASKRPIITTSLPSLVDILGSGKALLIAPGSSEGLSSGIESLLELGQKEVYSTEAFEAVKGYTWQERARKILESIK